MYLKLSSKKRGEAIEIAPDDVASQTQGLEEHIPAVNPHTTSKIDASHIHMQLAKDMFESDDRKPKAPVRIERSWRVSPEEFIVKIDASPLHQSAARRMFDKTKATPSHHPTEASTSHHHPSTLSSTAEEGDDTTTADTEPSEVHRSEWGEFWDNMSNLFFTGGGTTTSTSTSTSTSSDPK